MGTRTLKAGTPKLTPGGHKQKDSCLYNAPIGSTLKLRDQPKAVLHLFNGEVQALA